MTNRTRFSGSRGAPRGGGGGSCGNGSSARDGSTEDGSVTMLSRGVASVTPPAVSLSTVPAAPLSSPFSAEGLPAGNPLQQSPSRCQGLAGGFLSATLATCDRSLPIPLDAISRGHS